MLTLDEQLVRWYWCMFEFECVIVWYTMQYISPSQLHTHLLFKYTLMAMTHGCVLTLIEYMERYCVGFGRTGSTLVLVHV